MDIDKDNKGTEPTAPLKAANVRAAAQVDQDIKAGMPLEQAIAKELRAVDEAGKKFGKG